MTAPPATRTTRPHRRRLVRRFGGGGGGRPCPLTLGSDTNGSIRVPASLCGVFGLKPTLGRLSRQGAFPFVESLDHVGPFARTMADLALAYDLMQGPDPLDPLCRRPAEPVAPRLQRLSPTNLSASACWAAGSHRAPFPRCWRRWRSSPTPCRPSAASSCPAPSWPAPPPSA